MRKKLMTNGRVISVVALILVLSIVFISALLVGEHHCSEDNCIICLLSSNMTSWGISIKAVCVLILIVGLVGFCKFNNNPSQTLITLKRKLTI